MPRSNKDGQRDRKKAGAEHEDYVRRALVSWLEDGNLDDLYEVVEQESRRKISFRLTGATSDYEKKLDYMIVCKVTNTVVLLGGGKCSFKDRLDQDMFVWFHIKPSYPSAIWLESFVRESKLQDINAIRQKMRKIKSKYGDLLDCVLSTADADSMNLARLCVLTHLRRINP